MYSAFECSSYFPTAVDESSVVNFYNNFKPSCWSAANAQVLAF